jgi:hypothetical protein
MKKLLINLIFLAATPAAADVYECVDSAGQKKYTNKASEAEGCVNLKIPAVVPTVATPQPLTKSQKAKGGVAIGMTKEKVLASNWGKPNSVNKTTTTAGIREQWVYPWGNYLYFENGVLTAIQNRE